VDHGVGVVVTDNHGNRAASSAWMMLLVRQFCYVRFAVKSDPTYLGRIQAEKY